MKGSRTRSAGPDPLSSLLKKPAENRQWQKMCTTKKIGRKWLKAKRVTLAKKEPGRPWPLQNSEGGGSIQGQIGLQKGAP